MELSSYKVHKQFLFSQKKSGGRNNKGRITVKHRGGGHKQSFRKID
jgi:large subunit ribosomal protein L2